MALHCPTLPPVVDAFTCYMMCTQASSLVKMQAMDVACRLHTAAKRLTLAVTAESEDCVETGALDGAPFKKHLAYNYERLLLTSSSELSGSMWHSPEAISTPEAAQVSVLAAACRRGVSLPLRTSSGSMPATAATINNSEAAVILKIVIASTVAAELIATGVSADLVCW
jgi:hypothetical protein